jgi:hypothetical protein
MRLELSRILSIQSLGRRHSRALAITCALATMASTTSFNPASAENWLPDGSVAIIRPVPKQNLFSEPMARMRSPIKPEVDTITEPRLTVERTNHSVTLQVPGQPPLTMRANGAYALKPGSFTIALKQNDPLWYAPPTYFLRRGMKVPPEGSKARFMRGALGHKALFIDKQIAIHSGPVWTEEIGGLRVSEEDMAKLFDVLPIGTKVDVR